MDTQTDEIIADTLKELYFDISEDDYRINI